ncbi:MAG: SCO family protein [Verrucomicrobia bacterium]|nr:SCO family protein [Verrucomicrobiota bacterium]
MPRKLLFFCAVMLVLAWLVLSLMNDAYKRLQNSGKVSGGNSLSALNRIPDFTLTNSFAKPFGLGDLTGKVWVADFVFTTCQTMCPIMMEQTVKLQKVLPRTKDLAFVSISVTPDYDTPEVLAEFAAKHRANRAYWHFLTGPMEDIKDLSVKGLKIGTQDDPVNHSSYFVLVDRNAAVRGYYDGMDEKAMKRLKKDIRHLLEKPRD